MQIYAALRMELGEVARGDDCRIFILGSLDTTDIPIQEMGMIGPLRSFEQPTVDRV